jgi:peptide/nickel transport system substrate-binding protein
MMLVRTGSDITSLGSVGRLLSGALALGALAATVTLSGCGGGDSGGGGSEANRGGRETGEPKRGGTLTALWAGDVDSLDPGGTYYTPGYVVARATQRTLMGYRPGDAAAPVPDLAAAPPEVSGDGKTVTVRIRDGVRFSPPVDRKVTSRDVKYGIERGFFRTVANGYVGSYFADLVGARPGATPGRTIAGIETPDAHTVVFRLRRSTGRLLAGALTMPLAAPVPREYALRYDRRRPSAYAAHQVATGPYMVQADAEGRVTGYRAGQRISLVRNPRWDRRTDTKPAYLDGVEIRQGNTAQGLATRRVLRSGGMVTGDFSPPAAELERALRRDRDQLALPFANGTRYVALNTALPPLDDLNVRKAIVAGFDRRAMQLTRGGTAAAALASHFIPPGTPGFAAAGGHRGPGDDFVAHPGGDVSLAARYLRRAGYASGRYEGDTELLMVGVAGGNDQRAAEIARNSLERLGFKVKLRLATAETMLTRFCGTPSARVHVCPNLFWVRDFADAQTVLAPTFSGESIAPQGNTNVSQLDVPAIDRAMARAARAVDPRSRAEAWGDVDRMVTAEAAAVPVSWDRVPLVRSADVVGVVSEHLAQFDPTFTWLR